MRPVFLVLGLFVVLVVALKFALFFLPSAKPDNSTKSDNEEYLIGEMLIDNHEEYLIKEVLIEKNNL